MEHEKFRDPKLVLVHGVGTVNPADLLRDWTDALGEGARKAGHSDFARRMAGGGVRIQVAHYADLFGKAQKQGATDFDLDEDSAAIVAAMLVEIAESQARDKAGMAALGLARGQLTSVGQKQGVGDLVRRLLSVGTALLSLPGLRSTGRWLTSAAMIGDLSQVARYLARKEPGPGGTTLDSRIRDRFRSSLDDGAVVVAHSLGTIVAWEALHETNRHIALFVTIGSPLALRSAVLPKLRPQPPSTPAAVGRWLNYWDRDDVLLARPRLEDVFGRNPRGVQPVSARVDADGWWVHPAVTYLDHGDVAGPIVEALDR